MLGYFIYVYFDSRKEYLQFKTQYLSEQFEKFFKQNNYPIRMMADFVKNFHYCPGYLFKT